jgi:hypothetical protein
MRIVAFHMFADHYSQRTHEMRLPKWLWNALCTVLVLLRGFFAGMFGVLSMHWVSMHMPFLSASQAQAWQLELERLPCVHTCVRFLHLLVL